MAAYTEHYGLHQWQPGDSFLRTDFNTDLKTIDTALGGLEQDKAELVFGTYTGDGGASRAISLGFRPRALYLCDQGGATGYASGYYYVSGGLALPNIPIVSPGQGKLSAVAITDTGFSLSADDFRKVNEENMIYLYWALR